MSMEGSRRHSSKRNIENTMKMMLSAPKDNFNPAAQDRIKRETLLKMVFKKLDEPESNLYLYNPYFGLNFEVPEDMPDGKSNSYLFSASICRLIKASKRKYSIKVGLIVDNIQFMSTFALGILSHLVLQCTPILLTLSSCTLEVFSFHAYFRTMMT